MAKSLKLYTKPRKKRIGPEATLQRAVVQYLRVAGVPGLLFFSVPNEGKRSPRMANYLKSLGMLPGVSDLVIIFPSDGMFKHRVMFLELKAKGGKLSPAQETFGQLAVMSGCHWSCANNIDDAIKLLTEYGAIKPVSRRASPFAKAA